MKFIFDLDGTICFKGQLLDPVINKALDQLIFDGHEVIFASARPIRDMLPVLDDRFHSHTLIGGNGSLTSIAREVVFSKHFDEETLNKLLRIIDKYDASYLIDGTWNYSYTGDKDHPILNNLDIDHTASNVDVFNLDKVVKVLILSSNDMMEMSRELTHLNVFMNQHTNENIIDISPNGISKWSAIKELGIKEESYIAFGNDANDITMFQHALYSVMVGMHKDLEAYSSTYIEINNEPNTAVANKIIELSKQYR